MAALYRDWDRNPVRVCCVRRRDAQLHDAHFSLQSTLVSALCSVGPATLILVGPPTALATSQKILLCLLTAVAVVVLLSLWTVPRIGWNYASRLFLIPEAISLVISMFSLLD